MLKPCHKHLRCILGDLAVWHISNRFNTPFFFQFLACHSSDFYIAKIKIHAHSGDSTCTFGSTPKNLKKKMHFRWHSDTTFGDIAIPHVIWCTYWVRFMPNFNYHDPIHWVKIDNLYLNIRIRDRYLGSFLLRIWWIPFCEPHFSLSTDEKHKVNLQPKNIINFL